MDIDCKGRRVVVKGWSQKVGSVGLKPKTTAYYTNPLHNHVWYGVGYRSITVF